MGIFGIDAAGQDAVNLFGHKVPVSMLGVAAAVLGALLVLHARSSGGNVVSAGSTSTPASSTSGSTYSSSAYDPDAEAIADLQASVTSLNNELSALSSTPAATTPTSTTTPSPIVSWAPQGQLAMILGNPISDRQASAAAVPAATGGTAAASALMLPGSSQTPQAIPPGVGILGLRPLISPFASEPSGVLT